MIDPVTGAALAEGLAGITSGLAGQSLADAYNSNMTDSYDPYDPTMGGLHYGYGTHTEETPAISGDTQGSIVDSTQADPVDAWHDYLENEPGSASQVTGGIVSGSTATTFNYSLLEDPNGDVKAVAPVSVPVDQAYVAISQALGVSIRVSEIDPVLGNNMFQAIVAAGVVYDTARGLVTAWWDGVNILFPKKAVDAIQGVIDEEGIGPDQGGIINVPADNPLEVPAFSYGSTTGRPYFFCVRKDESSSGWQVTSQGPGTDYYYDGKGVTVGSGNVGRPDSTYITTQVGETSTYRGYQNQIAWLMVYGGYTPPSGYPEGTSQSHATAYTPSTIPSAGGIATSPSTTEPVVPINLPEDALDTTHSTVDPISATDEDTVSDLPAPPLPLPIPDTNVTNPDVPLVDATVVDTVLIDELVEELANTLDPQPPLSSGTIPFPFMPGTPVDPDDPSAGSSYPSIVPASGSGLIHVYNPTPGEFVSFGNWLWVTYADATIDKIWNNPFDGIIGAHELYATPQTDGSDNIRSGFLVCPTTAALVRQRYTEIDCGTVVIPEFYGNYFDYSPYSQAYIYLPFIGINEVSIDDIVGHAVNIRYRVDAYNGSCIAMIYVAKSGYRNLCYQFAGNCAVEVPLAGGSQAAIKAGMMQAEAYSRAAIQSAQIQKTASIGSGILNGAAGSSWAGPLAGIIGALAGGASGYIQGSANVAAAKLQGQAMQEAARYANKSSVQHSGQFGASHGAMGLKVPFIMIRNPIQVKVVNYNDDYGFPAHKRVIIGGCTGYIRVREVNVISAHATNEEKRAIEEELKAGVYVS